MSDKQHENKAGESAVWQEQSTTEPVQVYNDRDQSQAAAEYESKQNLSTDKPEANEQPVQPPKKRLRIAVKSSTASETKVKLIFKDPFPYARLRGIRIFSEREIEAQDAEMTKSYWRFWNRTAEELCSDCAYNGWCKRDLKLYIDAAWIIHKTYMQELTELQLRENLTELQEKFGYIEIPQKIKTQDKTVTTSLSKLQESTANLNQVNLDFAKCRKKFVNLKQQPVTSSYTKSQKQEDERQMGEEIIEHEKKLYDGMTKVKRDQNYLKRVLKKFKKLIFKVILPHLLDYKLLKG